MNIIKNPKRTHAAKQLIEFHVHSTDISIARESAIHKCITYSMAAHKSGARMYYQPRMHRMPNGDMAFAVMAINYEDDINALIDTCGHADWHDDDQRYRAIQMCAALIRRGRTYSDITARLQSLVAAPLTPLPADQSVQHTS